MERPEDIFDAGPILGLVQSALDPDERKFFKARLGQDSPDIMDYLMPTGRFAKARDFREEIVRAVLTEAMTPRSTVGEAQILDPEFPVPPNALKSRQEPIQGPGAPVPVWSKSDLQAVQELGASPELLSEYAALKQEGPQPTVTKQYIDPNVLLPRVFQRELELRQEAHKLAAGRQPHYASAEEQKLNLGLRTGIEAFRYSHGRDPNPEELNTLVTQVTGGFEKAPIPGSLGEKKLAGEAKASVAKGDYADEKEKAEIFAARSKGERDTADAAETWKLTGAKLEEIIQRQLLEKAQTSSAYQKADAGEFNEALRAAQLYAAINKSTKLSPEDKITLMNDVLRQRGDASSYEVIPKQTPFEAFFGQDPSKTELKRTAPTLTPPPEQTPQTEEAAKAAKRAQAKILFDSMKDGEIKELNGVKYRRRGNILEPVK